MKKECMENLRKNLCSLLDCSGYCDAYKNRPSFAQLENWWIMEGISYTPCGCKVEPDGTCPHGEDSWLIILGII